MPQFFMTRNILHLDVVKTDDPRQVHGAAEGSNFLVSALSLLDHLLREGRVQDVDDVGQGGVDDFVVVGQTEELLRLEVEVDAVADVDAVRVGVGVATATLNNELIRNLYHIRGPLIVFVAVTSKRYHPLKDYNQWILKGPNINGTQKIP